MVLFLLFHCGSPRIVRATDVDVLAQAELRDLLARPAVGALAVELTPQVQRFYVLSDYSLAWSRNGVPTSQALAICVLLKNAELKGLQSEDYSAAALNTQMDEILREKPSSEQIARLDFELTTTVIHFATDLSIGRIDPRGLQFALDSERKKTEIPDFLVSRLIHAENVPEVIAELEPPFLGYHRTESALQKYLDMAKAGEDPLLPIPANPIRAGDSYANAQQLAQRLARLGDVVEPSSGELLFYSLPLTEGVKRFQQRHGLNPDGILDHLTVAELNRPISYRILQLELTLERWRWLPSAFVRPPIAINIPEFKLRAYDENHHAALEMPIIVGKAYEHQTPVFQDQLEGVIFRPYWNVPLSIQRSELVPRILKDPDFLIRENFEITTSDGEVVSTGAVSKSILQQLSSGHLHVRQRPGPQNALGLIKFVFPNKYDVYLHGTPARELFQHPRRDFSHGCIRVEDPVALASWVLRSDPSWTVERIREEMTGQDSREVKLPNPFPVLILYGTAVVEENGSVHFFHDIYGHDAALLQALEMHSRRDQGH